MSAPETPEGGEPRKLYPTHFSVIVDEWARRVEMGADPMVPQMLIAAAEHFATEFPNLPVFDEPPFAHRDFAIIETARRRYENHARRRK